MGLTKLGGKPGLARGLLLWARGLPGWVRGLPFADLGSGVFSRQQEPLKGIQLGERPRDICIQKEPLAAVWRVSSGMPVASTGELEEVEWTGLDEHREACCWVVPWLPSPH